MKNKYVYVIALVLLLFVAGFATDASATAFGDPAARGSSSGKSNGDLIPVDESVDAGQITIGATAQVVVLFRNDGSRPVTMGAIQLYPSSTVSGNVSLNQCSAEPLESGAQCAVGVSVKGLSAGAWRIEMIMRHSGRARLVTATLSGQVEAGEGASDKFISDIEAIPDELDFGDLETSQPIIRAVVMRNTTSEPIDINAIYIEAADQSGYSLRTDCNRLLPAQACIVTVTWSPVLKGEATGALLIEHSGPTSVASIDLTGVFDPENTEPAEVFPEAVPGKGLMVSSQDEVDFGGGISTTSAITVSLVNVGDSPLTIQDLGLANSDNGLSLSKRGCEVGTVLEPIEACPLTLTWSPVREGAILDDVQIYHDGARGILVIPVRGTASAVISQDSKALRLSSNTVTASLADGSVGDEDVIVIRDQDVDAASVLDGFIITSHSSKRAIIAGPGGSRIVFDGEEVVIGGFLWKIKITSSGVQFQTGTDKVLLLFDRSLSSINRVSGQSNSSSSSSTTSATTN